jgi:hypothetical protein
MPLISMLLIKLVIVVNIMLFITTIILYFKGKEFINNFKRKFYKKVIFKVLVPPLALCHYSGILDYQTLIRFKFNKNKNDRN